MAIYAAPGATFEAVVQGFATGLTGTIGVRIRDNAGADSTARTTAGIAEDIASSGIYRVSLTAPSTQGQYAVVWDDGSISGPSDVAVEDLVVTSSAPVVSTGSLYVTADALRSTLSISGETYADDDIDAALESASRAADDLCGRRFYKDSVDATRYYTPRAARFLAIDDLADFTSLTIDDDGDGTFDTTWTENTDFVFEPLNAEADGRPRTSIRLHPNNGSSFPTRYPRSVKLVGRFGWDAVPSKVSTATSLLATILLKRMREAPFGVVALGVDQAAMIAQTDPQVRMLLDPYRRLTV